MKAIARTLAIGALALGVGLAAPIEAGAQTDFPTGPIRIIVGFAPGGSSDQTARLIAPHMQEYLGVPVIVENRVGAQGRVGADAVAKAEPDGYTLLVTTETSVVIAAHMGEPLPYDPRTDLQPVSLVLRLGNVILTRPDSDIETMEDLINAARERPGELAYAHSGEGGSLHLAFEMVKHALDLDIRGIPYGAGSGAIMPALLSGEIDLTIATVSPWVGHINDGLVRPLAVTLPDRLEQFPDVPTVAEAGNVPGFGIDSMIGVFTTAGTPDEVVQKLAEAVQAAVATEELQASFAQNTQIGVGSTPEEYEAILEEADEMYANLARQLQSQ